MHSRYWVRLTNFNISPFVSSFPKPENVSAESTSSEIFNQIYTNRLSVYLVATKPV